MHNFEDNITELEDTIARELSTFLEKNDLPGASNHCFNRIVGETAASADFNQNIQRYLYAIQALQLQIEAKHLKQHEIEQLLRIAESSLQLAGISEGSRRGYLYEEIYNCKSNLMQQAGKPLGAQWELLIGKRFLSTDIVWVNSAISETMALFHMGYAEEALRGFKKLLEYHVDAEQTLFLELQCIKAARLCGHLDEAHELIQGMIHDESLDAKTQELLRWEASWLKMTQKGRFEDFSKMIRRGREYPEEPYLSLIYLLYHCQPNAMGLVKDLPALATIRKRQSKKRSETDMLLFEILEVFAALYDAGITIKARLSRVSELLDRVHILHPEYQLLFFLGLARWAYRAKQRGFIQIALNKYQNLSHMMSNYRSNDVLGLAHDMHDLGSALWFLNDTSEHKTMGLKVMTRPIGRRMRVWMHYAKMSFQIMSRCDDPKIKAKNLAKSILQNSIEQSVVITGPYAKGLQHLSQTVASLMGFDESFNHDLAKVYCSIPPENAINFRATFQKEFHQDLADVFSSWEENPFGGGSLSQVFRARMKNGRDVAIKIKYPNIEAAIKRDFTLSKFALPLLKRFSRSFTLYTFDMIRDSFLTELDYDREVAMLLRFRDIFRDERDILIPEPVMEYCSKNCITMDYLDGESFEHFCESASQEKKNHAGGLLAKVFLESGLGHNLHKTDFFSANFRFTEGKIVLLDFGRVISAPAAFHEEVLWAFWNVFFDRAKFKIPLPKEVKVIEEEVTTFIFKHLIDPWTASMDNPVPGIADMDAFRQDLLDAVFRAAPKMTQMINPMDYPLIEGWFGFSYVMVRLNLHFCWHRLMLDCITRHPPQGADVTQLGA